MTLQELYAYIDGDYEQVIRVLRVDRLVDKHIRKLVNNGVIDNLLQAGEKMDPEKLFETAHAAKGVCANLGLAALAEEASRIAEEYRPGTERAMSDAQVKELLGDIRTRYTKTAEGIRRYTEEGRG